MNEMQRKIWDYLERNAVGKRNAIEIKKMAKDLGFLPKGTNNDDVRAAITNMVKKENLPIGSSSEGVFIFTDDEEREEAAKYVERETKSDAIRKITPYSTK